MEPRALSSAQNPIAQRFRRVLQAARGRREGVFILEGRHILEEAMRAGWPIEVLLIQQDLWPRFSLSIAGLSPAPATYLVTRDLLSRLGTVAAPEGVLALAPRREAPPPSPRPGDLFLYLDGIQDPANVGILVRSAHSFSLRGVLFGPGTADPFAPTALARSAGAALHLPPIYRNTDEFLAWAARGGVHLLAAEPGAAAPAALAPGVAPKVLVVGNEGRGISREIRSACSGIVSVPMAPNWDSLNVAAAGSILMYLLSSGRLASSGARQP